MGKNVTEIKRFAADQVKRRKNEFRKRLEKWLSCGDGPLPTDNSCVLWLGVKTRDGYGKMNVWDKGEMKQIYLHRLFWVLANGRDIPTGMEIDHKCRSRNCVRPDHMQLATRRENAAYVAARRFGE